MRDYSVTFTGVAITVAQDLFEVLAGSNKPLAVLGFSLAQTTEVGDAQDEHLLVLLKRGLADVTSGSGGSAATIVPKLHGATASVATVEANNTTKMTGGTIVTLGAFQWPVRRGLVHFFPPGQEPIVLSGHRLTLELNGAPADSITVSGTLWLRELNY